ncbi:MAG TPA: ATP-dependent metallopeptidase FtsH/Yme1/Tma family protein, partial [Bacteroidota bacterium]
MAPQKPQRKQNKQFRDDEFNWNKVGRVIASWLGILLAVFLVMYAFKSNEETEYEISFTTFQQMMEENRISEALIKKSNLNDYDFHGKLTQPMDITTS